MVGDGSKMPTQVQLDDNAYQLLYSVKRYLRDHKSQEGASMSDAVRELSNQIENYSFKSVLQRVQKDIFDEKQTKLEVKK